MAAETETRRTDRAGSFASASTEAGTLEEREKLAKLDALDDDGAKLTPPEDLEVGEEREDEELLPQVDEKPAPPKSTFRSSAIWMVINTLATIGIVRFPSCSCPHRRGGDDVAR